MRQGKAKLLPSVRGAHLSYSWCRVSAGTVRTGRVKQCLGTLTRAMEECTHLHRSAQEAPLQPKGEGENLMEPNHSAHRQFLLFLSGASSSSIKGLFLWESYYTTVGQLGLDLQAGKARDTRLRHGIGEALPAAPVAPATLPLQFRLRRRTR